MLVDEYLEYYRELVAKKIGEKNIVLLQNGMFYEMYNYRCTDGPDLFAMADLLGIQLARKNKEIQEVTRNNYELVGFPMHAQQKFINIFLQNGYTIAIYIQDDNGKKGVNRVLDQIISPSTTLDYCLQYDNNYLMCIYLEPHRNQRDEFYICAYSLIDLTVGNNYVYETSSRKGDFQYGIDKLYQTIKLYNPREIVIYINREYLLGDNDWHYNRERIVTELELEIDGRVYHYREDGIPADFFKVSYQNSFLETIFPRLSMLTPIEYLDLERYPSAVVCYMLLLTFAKEHRADIIQKISRPVLLENQDTLLLTQNSIYQLNIVPDKNQSNSKTTSLLNILNHCSTAFGKRQFRERLLNPILSTHTLNRGYQQVEEMIPYYKEAEEYLGKIIDLERIHRRLALKILAPNEFYNMNLSSKVVLQFISWLKTKFPHWVDDDTVTQYKLFIDDYESKIDTEKLYRYNMKSIERSIFRQGVFPEIDEIDKQIQFYEDCLSELAMSLSSYIDGSSQENVLVSVCSNDKEGYYLELTKKRCDNMREHLGNKILEIKGIQVDTKDLAFHQISQSNKNIRIVGKIIKKWSDKILEFTKKMDVLATERYKETLGLLDEQHHHTLQKVISWIGSIDIIKTHARNAVILNLKRPQIAETDHSFVKIKGLRHPIVEAVQTKTPFIANDITLGTDEIYMALCYGYNAVGKTTKQKAICIAIIMAQCGGFVAASSMTFCPYRYIFTRISNVDNLLKNQSSFMVEMMELKYILKHANDKSLVCIDELVASTERYSGIALVASTILELHERKCSMFMATHLHELSKMTEITSLPYLKIYHLEVHYDPVTKTLIYNRKLQEGPGTGLYGLEVAQYLELDKKFMDTSYRIRNEFLGSESKVYDGVKSNYNPDVYLVACQHCGYKPIHSTDKPLETHHINFQCNADQNGNFAEYGFHKNVEHNLVALCRECHQKVHGGELEIKGYVSTGVGPKLEAVEQSYEPPVKTSRRKLKQDQINIIKERLQAASPSTKKCDIIKTLDIEHQIKIDYKILKQIKNGQYS